jgi:putative transposase
MKVSQMKRLKALEQENLRLRKAVSDLSLDKVILQEAATGNF